MVRCRASRCGWLSLALFACGDASSADDQGTGTTMAVGSEATGALTASASATAPTSSSESASSGEATGSTTADPATTGDEDSTGNPPGGGLGIEGEQFTWNGVPTFLLGVSYFDARNWHDDDFEGLASRGWNLVRIWLDWGDASLFGADGVLSAEGAETLEALVDAAAAREIVVDVTILDPTLTFAADADHRVAAAQSVASLLADRANVLYDVMNEHDHGDGPIDHAEAGVVVAALREVDAAAIITISSTGGHLVADDATVLGANVDAEIDEVGAAVVTPHLPRTSDWADQTDMRVDALRAHLDARGAVLPIYLQEEARRGHSGLDPGEAEFIQAATEARDAGAAAWIFHTDAGFDLATSTFFAALDPVEAGVVDGLPAAL